jgi:hypothetical protein
MLFIALSLKSLTLLIAIALFILLFLKRKNIYLGFLIIPFLFIFEFNYFYSRINVFNYEDNLSLLVFLQGFERAYLNSLDTLFIGQGFQQFGLLGNQGNLQETIYLINGDYLNLFDGGTLASKIIGEFGAIGIIALLIYVSLFYKAISHLRRSNLIQIDKNILYRIFIISAFIELFIRGLGYFSPGVFLLIVGVLGINKNKYVVPLNTLGLHKNDH